MPLLTRGGAALVLALLIGLSATGLSRLEEAADTLAPLPGGRAEVEAFRSTLQEFQLERVIRAGFRAPDVFEPKIFATIKGVRDRIALQDGVREIIDIFSVNEAHPRPDGSTDVGPLVEALPTTPEEAAQLRAKLLSRFHIAGNLVTRDATGLQLIVVPTAQADPAAVSRLIEQVLRDRTLPITGVQWGLGTVQANIEDRVRGVTTRWIAIGSVFMLTMLLVFLSDRRRSLPAGLIAATLGAGTGIAAAVFTLGSLPPPAMAAPILALPLGFVIATGIMSTPDFGRFTAFWLFGAAAAAIWTLQPEAPAFPALLAAVRLTAGILAGAALAGLAIRIIVGGEAEPPPPPTRHAALADSPRLFWLAIALLAACGIAIAAVPIAFDSAVVSGGSWQPGSRIAEGQSFFARNFNGNRIFIARVDGDHRLPTTVQAVEDLRARLLWRIGVADVTVTDAAQVLRESAAALTGRPVMPGAPEQVASLFELALGDPAVRFVVGPKLDTSLFQVAVPLALAADAANVDALTQLARDMDQSGVCPPGLAAEWPASAYAQGLLPLAAPFRQRLMCTAGLAALMGKAGTPRQIRDWLRHASFTSVEQAVLAAAPVEAERIASYLRNEWDAQVNPAAAQGLAALLAPATAPPVSIPPGAAALLEAAGVPPHAVGSLRDVVADARTPAVMAALRAWIEAGLGSGSLANHCGEHSFCGFLLRGAAADLFNGQVHTPEAKAPVVSVTPTGPLILGQHADKYGSRALGGWLHWCLFTVLLGSLLFAGRHGFETSRRLLSHVVWVALAIAGGCSAAVAWYLVPGALGAGHELATAGIAPAALLAPWCVIAASAWPRRIEAMRSAVFGGVMLFAPLTQSAMPPVQHMGLHGMAAFGAAAVAVFALHTLWVRRAD